MPTSFRRRFFVLVSCLTWVSIASSRDVVADEPAAENLGRVELGEVWRIWGDGMHNAFPGIARHGDHYYVTFRRGQEHAEQTDAKILVIRSRADDLKTWEPVAEFVRDHDSRDPLLFVVGKHLQVVWHSKNDWYSRTEDGTTWSEPQLLDVDFPKSPEGGDLRFTSDRRWLFRIRRGPDGAFYSLARCGIPEKGTRGPYGLILFRSEDGIQFRALHTFGEGPTGATAKIAGSWGHEADVAWRPDGSLIAAVRGREGTIAQAPAANGPWTAYKTGIFNFGGPAFHTTPDGTVLLAARSEPESRIGPSKQFVWTVGRDALHHPVELPSASDCAYSSFADAPNGDVLLCYYSGHDRIEKKDGSRRPANIYLARLTVKKRSQ